MSEPERSEDPGSKLPHPTGYQHYAYVVLAIVLVAWLFFGRDWFIELGVLAAGGYIGWKRPRRFAWNRESALVATAGIGVALLVYLGWNESWYRLASSIAWSGIGLALGTIVARSRRSDGGRWLGWLRRPTATTTESPSFRERFDAELEQERDA